jgi:hypothetical protein
MRLLVAHPALHTVFGVQPEATAALQNLQQAINE